MTGTPELLDRIKKLEEQIKEIHQLMDAAPFCFIHMITHGKGGRCPVIGCPTYENNYGHIVNANYWQNK